MEKLTESAVDASTSASSGDAVGVVLFDGVCSLCNGAVNFIIDRDPKGRLKFAALQSGAAAKLLEGHDVDPDSLDSILLVEGERCYSHSTAGLRIARRLRWPWSWAYVFIIVPRFLRNIVYRWIARNRYRWFGKEEQCRVPTPELRARFVPEP